MQDLYDDVLRDGVGLIGLLHDARVMLDGAVFRVNDALYDVYDVHLVLGRLQLILRRLELHRAWHDTVELLDAGRELLGVGKLFLYVFLHALLDLLGADAVRVYGVGHVIHDGLQLHKVSCLQKLDDLLALLRHLFGKNALAAAIGLHALCPPIRSHAIHTGNVPSHPTVKRKLKNSPPFSDALYLSCSFGSVRASIAASTHSSASAPVEAVTPAAKAPSTKGASTRVTLSRFSEGSISRTVCAERTALPRSMKTSTSSASRSLMETSILSGSVPKEPSASPPTAEISTSPAICKTRSAVPSAISLLCETSTIPTIRKYLPAPAPRHPGAYT